MLEMELDNALVYVKSLEKNTCSDPVPERGKKLLAYTTEVMYRFI